MKSIGEHLKNARKVRGKSVLELSRETKIKESFIKKIEKDAWQKLPEYPVVLGFVKNIAQALDLNSKNVVALLRRDYPPRRLAINPKPELAPDFRWSPRLTFFLGASVVLLGIVGYLVIQYAQFTRPPSLSVSQPMEGVVIEGQNLKVEGKTDTEASVSVNGQPAFVDEQGNFYTEVEVSENLKSLEIIARSRSGKETKVVRGIKFE